MPNMRSTYIRRRASSGSGRVYIQLSSYLILPHELIAAAAFFFFGKKVKQRSVSYSLARVAELLLITHPSVWLPHCLHVSIPH